MKITEYSPHNHQSFKMSVKFKKGGAMRMAEAFKDFQQEAKEYITRQADNKYADIIVSENGVSVAEVLSPLKMGEEIEILGKTKVKKPFWHFKKPEEYAFMVRKNGKKEKFPVSKNDQVNMNLFGNELQPYKEFQIAEYIADSIKNKRINELKNLKLDTDEAKIKQLEKELLNYAETID